MTDVLSFYKPFHKQSEDTRMSLIKFVRRNRQLTEKHRLPFPEEERISLFKETLMDQYETHLANVSRRPYAKPYSELSAGGRPSES